MTIVDVDDDDEQEGFSPEYPVAEEAMDTDVLETITGGWDESSSL